MIEIQNKISNFELLDYVPMGVCIIDINFTVIFWNFCIEQLTQIKRIDILGKNILQSFKKLQNNKYKLPINSILEGGPPVIFSSQLHKNLFTSELDPHLFRIEHTTVSAIPGKNENEYYAMFSIEDVTDLTDKIKNYKLMRDQALIEIENRKKIEIELNHSQSVLEILNATKDKFFSIIAHDLINPIAGLKQVIEMMTAEFIDLTNEEKLEILDALKISSVSVFELLQNLLTWSRSQRGTIDFHPVSLNLSGIIKSIISLNRIMADNKKISIIDESNENDFVIADKNMISTILRNLMTNAIKFTPLEGSITIGSMISEINDEIIVYVKDNGIGIPQEKIDKLFKIESTFTTSGTSYEKGTGLGLIICKEFVEKHDGRIWVESKENIGTTFYFTLKNNN